MFPHCGLGTNFVFTCSRFWLHLMSMEFLVGNILMTFTAKFILGEGNIPHGNGFFWVVGKLTKNTLVFISSIASWVINTCRLA